jgi:chromosomal replication initiator protein
MPTLHQEPDDMVVVGKIKDVLEQRIGSDRFGLWFGNRVEFRYHSSILWVVVDGDFALERLRGNYFRAIESAAAEVLCRSVTVRLMLQADNDAMLASDGVAETGTAEQVAPAPDSGGHDGESARQDIQDFTDRPDFAVPGGGNQPIKKRPTAPPGGSAQRRQSNSSEKRSNSYANQGPTAVGQWMVASATDPRHSRKQSRTSSNPIIRPSMSSSPNPIDAQGTPQAAQRPVNGRATGGVKTSDTAARNRASVRSIRVTTVDSPVSGSGMATSETSQVASTHSENGSFSLNQSGRNSDVMTFGNFVTSTSNTLAVTAAKMLVANPSGSVPLCFWGATGTGKTHLLSAIRHELRARHNMQRVLLLSAEDFTNDFLSCVRGTGLPAFRKRYRDVDALLVDNIQFLGGKNATLREMLYTVDTVLSRRRPLILAADRQPLEIEGLTADLAGRMSSGLVCGINPMELQLRRDLFRRHAQQSYLPWDEETIEMLAQRASGDGRVIRGLTQLVSMLQRMYRRMPTHEEIANQAGDLLQRGPKVVALADVEKAICTAFGLSGSELRSDSKSRNISQPRILAMYLSRQHTTAAFSEIGRYYGDRNHSTVIAAHRRVEDWIKSGRTVGGRGPKNLKVQDAIAAVENLLRIG